MSKVLFLWSKLHLSDFTNCSFIDYRNSFPLVECPQAKFMESEDLFECYDRFKKDKPYQGPDVLGGEY